MTSLVSLVAQIEQQIPSVDGVPTPAQIEESVRNAVMDFSRRIGRGATTDILLQSGSAMYQLPPDFLKCMRIELVYSPWSGMVKFPSYTIDSGACTLTVDPIPGTHASPYTPGSVWRIQYMTKYVLHDGVFVGLGDFEASILLLKALSLSFGYQIRHQGMNDVTGYSQGNFSVQRKSSPGESLRRQQSTLEEAYHEAIRGYLGKR